MANAPFTWGGQGPLALQPGGIQLTNGMFLANDGFKNYLSYNNAETNATTGWSLGTVTLTSKFPSGTPTFGSGANANLSLGVSSSSPVAGTYSYTYTSSAATTAGNFVASSAFTIDSADQAKPLTVQFYYTPSSNPSNGNWSGTTSNSFGIALYDVTTGGSSGWIMPAGVWSMTQSAGVGIATATFQTTASSTQYRLVIFNANATSGAITVKFDRFYLGPQTRPLGACETDTVNAGKITVKGTTSDPAIYASATTNQVLWRRIGDTAEITYQIYQTAAGSAGSGDYLVSLPSGLAFDSIIQPYTGSIGTNLQSVQAAQTALLPTTGTIASNAPAYSVNSVTAYAYSTTQFRVGLFYTYSGTISSGVWTSGNLHLGSTNLGVSITIRAKIAGWSSQVQSSSDTDTRVIDFNGYVSTNQVLTANTTNLPLTADRDSAGGWSGSTYVVPVAGDYNISATLLGSGAATIVAYVNGNSDRIMGSISAAQYYTVGCSLYGLKANDTISIRSQQNVTITGNSSKPYQGNVAIFRNAGPAVIAATETVAASYWVSTNFAASTTVPINFDSKDYDTHNAVTTSATAWKFTAPATGSYVIAGAIPTTNTNLTIYFNVFKNGSVYKCIGFASTASGIGSAVAGSIRLNAGDYIDFRPSGAVTAAGASTAGSVANISILRQGF